MGTSQKVLTVGMEITISKVGDIKDQVLQFEGLKVRVIRAEGPFVFLSDGDATVRVLADSRNNLVWVEYDRKAIAAEMQANLDQKETAFNKALAAEEENIRKMKDFPSDEAYIASLRKAELVTALGELGVETKVSE